MCIRDRHRRGVCGDGLASRAPGRHRGRVGRSAPERAGQPRPARAVRSVQLLDDRLALPVAVRVVAGNTADPTAFAHLATDVRDRFGLTDLVLVGDRGMITKARIEQLRDLGGLGWVTALRAPDVAALARDDGPLQMSLFDQANLAEITHPDFPDERLIACRNPARSAARAGLRQAIRRSSGKSGWVISARFAWSNRLICSGPSSRASAATSGARRAVTQPRPPRSRSCSIRALVIIPRSPTSTRSVNPKRSRTSVARWANAVGSAVLPATTRTATGRPTGSVSSPYSICGSPFLPSREYPRAANGQCEPVIQELDRSNSASRSGLTGALRCRSANAASMASWHSRSQSIAAYASSVLTSVRPRSAARVVSVHQRVVASFEPGRQTRATINATATSRCRPTGPSRFGRPSRWAWASTAATWPCGSERVT